MRGNQNLCIEGAQTTQWSTYKGQAMIYKALLKYLKIEPQ